MGLKWEEVGMINFLIELTYSQPIKSETQK